MIRKKQANSKRLRQGQPVTLGEARGLLRSQGKRITGQRALLLQLIQESEGHLDAAELYRRAKKGNSGINLATVYRTLSLLKEAGLVEPSYLTHDHRREQFESKPTAEHYHFTCLRCGRVIEFESPLFEQVGRMVKRQFGVQVTHACLCLEGYCSECAAKPK